ncbi:hypothetical protein I5M32_10165 [Pedobacter sp. SD-b]|uniref:LiaF transmembrane domain-containing protein n=1 Tax=Pedobacter segetis TaxID=2793069 RepID=A0ABS1BKA5_9SPHI|nr:DUF5668 domain-containing protein [Pedobacter segetis]MBK0383324.1 hypothetical protein [Pedobacter segetis]
MKDQEIKRKHNPNGKRIVGAAILVVGVVLFANQMGIFMPDWILSWPMLLIVIGLANGVKHNFRNSGWLIMVLIGGVFLLEKISPELSVSKFTWPLVLMGLGIWFIFGKGFKAGNCSRRGRRRWDNFDPAYQTSNNGFENEATKNDGPVVDQKHQTTGDEYIDSVSIFGATKKNILSKNFKGGDILTICGGCEISLINADINGMVILDVTQVFGGTKIVIPPTWDVSVEMSAVFGGVEDKRSLVQVLPDRSKVLLIKGSSVFAGIEIRNF